MTVGQLVAKLQRYDHDAEVVISFPNDDQDWPARIVVFNGQDELGEIEVGGA
jgi:hypothetical protein